MRGKPHRPKERGGTPGITPAGAGKTPRIALIGQLKKDHPRRCGENVDKRVADKWLEGSPPQVRGKLYVCKTVCKIDRITPAGAGKTVGKGCKGNGGQDHPRRCGENPTLIATATAKTGITPAGAGKTRP